MRRPARLVCRFLAALVLLAGFSTSGLASEKSAALLEALDSIQTQDLRGHVDYLADDKLEGRDPGTEGGRAAGAYLADRLAKLNLRGGGTDGGFFQPVPPLCRNVLAVLPGSDPAGKHQLVILSAHYDHVGYGTRQNSRGPVGYIHNGADDNASGTSGLLELAEAFATLPQAPARSILFAFWDGEEIGLLGSKYWVAHPTWSLRDVVAVINSDMIGSLRDDRVTVFGSRSGYGLRRLVCTQNGEPNLLLEFDWGLRANADHYPLFRHDMPVLTLHTGATDVYHTPYDDADLINHAGMRRVVRLAFGMAYELAECQAPPRFRPAAADESEATQRQWASLAARPAGRLGVTWQSQTEPGEGIVLTRIDPGSPAAKAGLKPGDRILEFAGRDIRTDDDLRIAVMRADSPAVALVKRPDAPEPQELTVSLSGQPMRLGIAWRLDEAEPGTIILTQVLAGSPAAQAGLRPGDRIYQVARQDFADDAQFTQLARTLHGPLELLVERDGQLRTVVLPVEDATGPPSA